MARSLLNQPVDEHGCTLLHVAAQAGKAEAVCLLLEAGADPALRYGCRAPSGSQPPLWESSSVSFCLSHRKLVPLLSWDSQYWSL